MPINDDNQIRAWCLDYSLRTPRTIAPEPLKVIADAKTYEAYVRGSKPATVIKIVKSTKRKINEKDTHQA